MNEGILYEGEVVLPSVLSEGGFDELHCDPPVRFRYVVFESNHYDAIVEFPFGLQTGFNIDPRLSFNKHFAGADDADSALKIITGHVKFELLHSFCHTEFDSNYTHLNWALKGWLKDQITVKENPLLNN